MSTININRAMRRARQRIAEAKRLHSKELDLSKSRLTSIPDECWELSNLTVLHINGNQLTELPPEIGKLSNLTQLHFNDNQLTELPPEIGKLSNMTHLWFEGNPLEIPPLTVCDEGIKAIRAYFEDMTMRGAKKRYEAKLMLVGEGLVGKTFLSEALRGLEPSKHDRTIGILIDKWSMPHPEAPGTEMVLNIWDYEGQEISRTTHQFFYSPDSLYLVVFNARAGHGKGNLNFWFEIISARAPGARVILVATECERTTSAFNFSFLREQFNDELRIYPQIVHVDSVSGMNLKRLRKLIIDEALKLKVMGMNWTVGWSQVEEQVIELCDKDQVKMSRRELYSIMKSIGVLDSDRESVTGMLDKFGIITHFPNHEELKDEIILNPEWLTAAVSRFIEDTDIIEKNGVFSKSDLDRVWSDFSENDRSFFYQCMEGFELCFKHKLSDERFLPLRFPDKLIDKPTNWVEDRSTRRIRFKFRFLPSALFPRFIVNTRHYGTGVFWRKGVMLEDKDTDTGNVTHRALCTISPEKAELYFEVTSRHAWTFMTKLREQLQPLLTFYKGAKPEVYMGCVALEDGSVCKGEFKLRDVEYAIATGTPFPCAEGQHIVTAQELERGYRAIREDKYAMKKEYHFHDVKESQIVIDSVNVNQQMKTDIDPKELAEVITLVKDYLVGEKVEQELRDEIEADLGSIQAQLKSPNPKTSIIKESLRSLRTILENVVSSVASEKLPLIIEKILQLL